MPRPPREVPLHWLRHNKTSNSPRAVIFFDTETRWETTDEIETHRMRLWTAAMVLREHNTEHLPAVRVEGGTTPLSLAHQLASWASERKETWAFAHNVAFDLAISGLPVLLAECGLPVTDWHFGTQISWLIAKDDRHRLTVTDSFSWLTGGMDDIGKLIGRRKARLPKNDDDDAAWQRRCLKDVEVLAEAMLTVMDWWDTADLGRFGLTSAACGFRAFRHRLGPGKILVGPDPDRTPFERQAIYGGRREAWRVGKITRTHATDWDFHQAYATTAANLPLPSRPGRHFDSLDSDDPMLAAKTVGIIARVKVTTDRPLAPWRHSGAVWWPVGTFTTVLASPEIEMATRLGAKVEIGEGWAYALSWTLAPFMAWVIATADGLTPDTPPVVCQMVKGWGRSIPGRFAMRAGREVFTRPSLCLGWGFGHGHEAGTGANVEMVSIGDVEHVSIQDQDAADCFPAVLAFTESYCRAALTETLMARGAGRIWQVDTDGFLEGPASTVEGSTDPVPPWPFAMRVKATAASVEILGPQHLTVGRDRRYSGVSRHADREDDGSFTWYDWPGLRWQMAHTDPGSYKRRRRNVTVTGGDLKRWVLADGSTMPVEVRTDPAGAERIANFAETFRPECGLVRAEHQHHELSGLG